MTNVDMLAPRKALLVAGADAHSRYYSEDVQAMAPDTVDLVIVPGADHVDLYDRKDLIPFDRLDEVPPAGRWPHRPVGKPPLPQPRRQANRPAAKPAVAVRRNQGGAGTARLSRPRPSFGMAAAPCVQTAGP
ncbi:hypothetical protein [Streptomyces sp. NPDC052015]|uniref:hypothetical protein n=1 Tax=Streptomyces sp. NPDC052015 TaxID=3154755 RepID=UPI003446B292